MSSGSSCGRRGAGWVCRALSAVASSKNDGAPASVITTAARLSFAAGRPSSWTRVASNYKQGIATFSTTTSAASVSRSETTQQNTAASSQQPPLLPSVTEMIESIKRAAKPNQGNPIVKSKRRARREYYWDYEFCRTTADAYEQYLHTLVADDNNSQAKEEAKERLLAPKMVSQAFTVLLRSKLQPDTLSERVRDWERALGTLAATPLTPELSLKLVQANGKSGNIGRVLSLLEYRRQHNYQPHRQEFIHAVTAVEAAGWYLRHNRNIFLGDRNQPSIDNPTRWLDAILLNMSARQVALDVELAARMLDTFASRGRTGKAVHYFYSVHRTPLKEREEEDAAAIDSSSEMEDLEEYDYLDTNEEQDQEPLEFQQAVLPSHHQPRPYKVRLKMKSPPPFYKIPTEMEGNLLAVAAPNQNNNKKNQKDNNSSNQQQSPPPGVLKLDRESEPNWSLPLTAAFSFADSLAYGACGHDPLELDLVCYNILLKTCVYRGALWRAMHLLDTVIPAAGLEPNVRSYDSLLSGLSRVGDVTQMRKYYQQMIAKEIAPSYYTVQCIVDGLLNLADVAGAITVIQDFFNQHNVLPPVTTQLKVLEFALGLDMIYEAKRHVYFIQQLWKWEPHYQYETRQYIYLMKTYQKDPRISKEALKHLFEYYGAKLEGSDFF